MTRRLCLITGASAGIGEAFAKLYARQGWDVALTARRADRLEALAQGLEEMHGVEAYVIPADLAEPDAPARIVETIHAQGRQIDGLINNAGFGLKGTYATTTWEDQAAFIQLMLTAPSELAHRAFKPMIERKFGRIINIASVVGLLPGAAGHTLYGPIKAYLVRLSEALDAEARAAGADVRVCGLCPGFTWSEFHDVNGMRALVSQKVPRSFWQTSDEVAEIGWRALEARKVVQVCGSRNRALVTLVRLLPDGLGRALIASQTSRYRSKD